MKANILSQNDKLHPVLAMDLNFDIQYSKNVNPRFYGDLLTNRCTSIHWEI